ncbi:ABC transporter permease [Georgenia muralis]|uniref:ABC-2 type transport system permease protein n=1 Tax=Georgenia muralis TaxID=154117 RepID=A0A3N4Z4W8_9MICO|nr:hypothetical protein [Georgenia muralis]RPF26964.1 ABC-2 type transport system permease protein [Georgenia muralis]
MSAAVATPPVAPTAPARDAARGALAGTGALVRLMLRRDRVRLPLWVGGIALFVPYFFTAFGALFPTTADLQQAASFTQGPVISLLGGPGYGLGEGITYQSFFAAVYWLYFLLAAALMNILLVSRHTRVEEQTGRSELVRANVVGAHAPLTAALVVAVIANAALAVVLTAALVGFDAPLGGAALVGAGTAAVGLVFAGVTAVTVQLTEYSRAASSAAGAVLGAGFVLRAIGDSLGEHGTALSWLSPFAWSQQTRPFVDERWWPLAISLVVAAGAAALGYALSLRRDVGAGLRPARRGRAEAADWLRGPTTLSWRLQRSGVRGWAIGLTIAGLVYGGVADTLVENFVDVTPELTAVLGNAEDSVAGYLALMVSMMSVATAVFAVLAVQRARSEEVEGRAEPVLATATSRTAWLGGHVAVVALASVFLVVLSSTAVGLGAAASTGQWHHVGDLALAGLVSAPAVLLVLGVAALLYGIAPRALTLAWVVVVVGFVMEFFGPLLEPPGWLTALSPWDHVPALPVEDLTLGPVLVLAALAVAGVAAGLAAFHRRDVVTT